MCVGYNTDDYTVTQSFIDSMLPTPHDMSSLSQSLFPYVPNTHFQDSASVLQYPICGLLLRYLSVSQIMFVYRDIVCVHGAINFRNIG